MKGEDPERIKAVMDLIRRIRHEDLPEDPVKAIDRKIAEKRRDIADRSSSCTDRIVGSGIGAMVLSNVGFATDIFLGCGALTLGGFVVASVLRRTRALNSGDRKEIDKLILEKEKLLAATVKPAPPAVPPPVPALLKIARPSTDFDSKPDAAAGPAVSQPPSPVQKRSVS